MAGFDEKSIEAQPGGSRADAIKRHYGSQIAELYTAALLCRWRRPVRLSGLFRVL